MSEADEGFKEYHAKIKDDFYSALQLRGIDKLDIPPLLLCIITEKLSIDAKMLWALKREIDTLTKFIGD